MKTQKEIQIIIDNSSNDNLAENIKKEIDLAYDEAYDDALDEMDEPEISELEKEEIGVNFCIEKFKDCKTLEDFQIEYFYIYSRSLNFMK